MRRWAERPQTSTFWIQNEDVLRQAWQEWYSFGHPGYDLMEDPFAILDETCWPLVCSSHSKNRTRGQGSLGRSDTHPVSLSSFPNSFLAGGVSALREFHLDVATELSNISHATRPNGMNRYGLVLDEQVEGRSVVPLFG
jgi:hypothetical protein